MASVDVSVRGAGIFGLSIAWACHRGGASVELVDPAGVAAGASGGIVGALAPHVPENWNPKKQFQLESLLMARAFWNEIADVSGQPTGYAALGRIQPLADASAISLAVERRAGACALWQGAAQWDVTDTAGGWQISSASGSYIFDTLSAHIHPRRACLALAGALSNVGIKVQPDATKEAGATIWATGAVGLKELSDQMPREVGRGIKGQAILLQADRAGLPQLFVDTLHIIPHLDGTVAIGSTTERDFDDPNGTDTQLDDLLDRAIAAVPELESAPVLHRWAGLRPRARSRAPMLGHWPDRPGQFIANGGFKIGFGMAPKVADTMARLVLHDEYMIPEGFDVLASL